MVFSNRFDWLDGTVTVPVGKPEAWVSSLDDFYSDPNDDRWGGQLCRVLYHESIHFWHFLASAYLANLVQDEWMRLRAYEDRGEWLPVTKAVSELTRTANGLPFSPFELMECWARYWDVHTRHAGRILREEGLDPPPADVVGAIGAPDDAYTSAHFDTFMQRGRDAAVYARPYRWALSQANGHSAFVNIVFPVLVFCAFGSPDPVRLFTTGFERARSSAEVQAAVRDRTGSINFDWLATYQTVITEAVVPTVRDLALPGMFTGGWDVLERGLLGEHPVYGTYRQRIGLAMASVQLFFNTSPAEDNSIGEHLRTATATAAVSDPFVLFMFPGQPTYRLHLGQSVPPPRVKFTDSVLYAEREFGGAALNKVRILSGTEASEDDFSLAPYYDSLDQRIRRFRNAEYAARRGKPLDTFIDEPAQE